MVTMVITSDGIDRQTPYGTELQPKGDSVWSAVIAPEWTVDDGDLVATVALPSNLPLFDKGRYTVTAAATDASTGLSSQVVSSAFSVEWSRKAPAPPTGAMIETSDNSIIEGKAYFTLDQETGEYEQVEEPTQSDLAIYFEETPTISVEPSEMVDEDGNIDRACTITLVPPAGAAQGDVYDIYRLTHEGARLIGKDFPLTATIVDTYAPFGDMTQFYRVSCKTEDGDENWADYDYYLNGAGIRFDFAGKEHRYVELPYNISVSDSYEKDYEGRKHMDGSRGGGWNDGVERTARLSTDVMRIVDAEIIEALYDMAQTAGPVFVRTPYGSAFEANVDMSSADIDDASILSCSFDAEECNLTSEFMLPPFERRIVEEGSTSNDEDGA